MAVTAQIYGPSLRVRVVSSGTTAVATVSTVTAATVTRVAGESLPPPRIWVTNNTAGATMAWQAGNAGGLDGVTAYYERSATANTFLLKLYNDNAAELTVDWIITAEST